MCGLGVMVGEFAVSEADAIEIFGRDLQARGPDEQRHVRDGDAFLFHSRLSIIGLGEPGSQPMLSDCGRFRMVFNGEIYNYRELAKELLQGDWTSYESDSQVLVECYAKYGSKIFSLIRGMFACVIYDTVNQMVCAARDFYGERPLYYSIFGKGLIFCSYASTITKLMGEQKICDSGLFEYFRYGNISAPDTIYEGVYSLPPGSIVEFERSTTGDFVEKRRMSLRHRAIEQATIQDVASSFRTAVERCLVSDVPVGIFMSGGIDSTAIFGVARQLDKPLHALSLIFPNSPESEHYRIEQTQNFYEKDIEQVEITEREFYESFDEYFSAQDVPSIDGLNTFLVSRVAARKGIKVWLSGVGGDELFGGYHSLSRAKMVAKLPKAARDFTALPGLVAFTERIFNASTRVSKLSRLLEFLETEISTRSIVDASRRMHSAREISRLLRSGSIRRNVRIYDGLPSMSSSSHNAWIDAEVGLYMTPQLLRDIDNMGMANSLEIRAPFLDIDLLVSAQSLSPDHFFNQKQGKEIFLNALDVKLPGFLRDSSKQGFSLPYRSWLLSKFDRLFEQSISHHQVQDLLDIDECRRLYRGFKRGEVAWYTVWAIFSFSRWLTHVVYK